MKWIEVQFQGKTLRVPALKSQGRLWFHWQGQNHVIDMVASSRRSGAATGVGKSGSIVAPMPGKVTRVAVEKASAVESGQMLVVMEAMKMEYTLSADRAGKVLEVCVQVGQQVALGELLVRVGDA